MFPHTNLEVIFALEKFLKQIKRSFSVIQIVDPNSRTISKIVLRTRVNGSANDFSMANRTLFV